VQELYNQLLNAKSVIDEQKTALLKTVSTDAFLPPGQHQYGNGHLEIVHTIYTDLLLDGLSATAYFGYKVPVTNPAGQVISNGIALTLTGSVNSAGKYSVQEIKAKSYALPHHSLRNDRSDSKRATLSY
jgi:hypothetical protein